ncbi:MAG: ABC transporter permease [Acidimicrobiales bacterium]
MLFATAELKRSWARFVGLTSGAGLLVFVLLFQQALLTVILDGVAGAVGRQSAPVLVFARDARRAVGGSLLTSEQLTTVAAQPGVADAAELGVTAVSIRGPGSERRHNASVVGYQPGRPGSPTGLETGRMPDAPNEVVASAEDAPGRYRVGDTLTVEPGDVELVVVGLTVRSRYGLSPTLWVSWPTYVQLVQLTVPNTTVVLPSVAAVEPAVGVDAADLVRELNAVAPELEAVTREDAAATAPGKEAIRLAFLVVLGLGHLVVAVVIAFFFLTLTLQKEPSITLLRAMGARASYLVRGLVCQVAAVTVGALAIGALLMALAVPVVRSTVPITLEPAAIASSGGTALAVALVGSVPPIRRVLRVDPNAVVSRPLLGTTR